MFYITCLSSQYHGMYMGCRPENEGEPPTGAFGRHHWGVIHSTDSQGNAKPKWCWWPNAELGIRGQIPAGRYLQSRLPIMPFIYIFVCIFLPLPIKPQLFHTYSERLNSSIEEMQRSGGKVPLSWSLWQEEAGLAQDCVKLCKCLHRAILLPSTHAYGTVMS